MKNIMFLKYLLFAIVFFIAFLPAQGQERKVIVCDKPSDEKDYKRWLEKNVLYIITKDEKESFLKLKTNDDREKFIENFWARRDPMFETEKNEFREIYYERIAFANENFASGIQGWKTDRGMIYILYGKPGKIEKGRGDFENLKDILFERWIYKNLAGESASVEFVFFDPTESNGFFLEKGKRESILKNGETGLKICFNCSSLE